MWVGTIVAALTFAFKIVEFIWTLDSPEAPGFAVVPVVTYFIVAAGYVLLFCGPIKRGNSNIWSSPKKCCCEGGRA